MQPEPPNYGQPPYQPQPPTGMPPVPPTQPPLQQPLPPQSPYPGYPGPVNQPQPQPPQAAPPSQVHPKYDFIMNPSKPPRRSLFGSSNSMAVRLILILGGLLVLVIIIGALKSALTPKPFNKDDMFAIVSQQQTLIDLTTYAANPSSSSQSATLTVGDQNSAATTQLALATAQTQLISYLKTNHTPVPKAYTDQGLGSSLTTQLNSAASAGNYDATFNQMMQTQLNTYKTDLATAYKVMTGVKGKALLSNEYNGAQLLLKQLESPES